MRSVPAGCVKDAGMPEIIICSGAEKGKLWQR